MTKKSEHLLLDLLIKKGFVDQADYDKLSKMRPAHQTIRTFIVDKRLVTEKEIVSLLSSEQGIPSFDFYQFRANEALISEIPSHQALTYEVFPLKKEENGDILLGIVDPFKPNLFEDLRFSLPFRFKMCLISKTDHQSLFKQHYEQDLEEELFSLSEEESSQLLTPKDELEVGVDEAPVVKLLNSILIQAVKDHASDIHFEPFEEEFKIRYRIDGTLYEMIPPPRNLALSVLSRIKVMAGMNIAEKRVPQDGRILLKLDKKAVDFRVSTLPTAFGESAVLRILDRSHLSLHLDNLGLGLPLLKKIREIIRKPNGIFITTGPTGAGKTTTLYSCLNEINVEDTKIITTEDPVEYDIEGIVQMPINENIGLTFNHCLRSILRQDPDKIMVGEIRDQETMNMSIQASLTGHLVLSTLHTNDAASAITRLIDMGVEPFLICSSLEAILAQRLVRKICPSCKVSFKPNSEMLKHLGLDIESQKENTFFYGKGCESCGDIGYKGQTGIYELIEMDDSIKAMIMENATAGMIEDYAKKKGMVSLLDDGVEKIKRGLTTIEEVVSCAVSKH